MSFSYQDPTASSSSTTYPRRIYRRRSTSTPSSASSAPSSHSRSRSRSRRSPSSESDVEESLPPSPSDPLFSTPLSSSRAYRFAVEDQVRLVRARQAFEDVEPSIITEGTLLRDINEDTPIIDQVEAMQDMRVEGGGWEEDEPDELREIKEEDLAGDRERQEDDEEPPDERQCRICFGGPEEEESLGRLISPCLCSGSMRYVHVQCINAWRGTGSNAKAFMECPQCHHKYQLRRTLISGLATSRPIKLFLSSLSFLLLTLLAGQLLHLLLSYSPRTSKKIFKKQTTFLDIFSENWDEFDNGVIINVNGGTLIWDIVVGSIQTFSDVANRVLESRSGQKWIKNTLGLGDGTSKLLSLMGIRFLLGIAVLGSLSFLSLLLSLSLFAPFQLANGLRGVGLFNFARGRQRTGNNGREGTAAGQIMIIIFVLVGAVNTLVQVYRLVERITEKLLKYVETQILEVNSKDRERVNRETERMRRRRKEAGGKWWIVWWREGRWATRRGWEEVRFRLWMWARGGLGSVWERMWIGTHRAEDVREGRGRRRVGAVDVM